MTGFILFYILNFVVLSTMTLIAGFRIARLKSLGEWHPDLSISLREKMVTMIALVSWVGKLKTRKS